MVGDVRPFVLTADICLVYKCTKHEVQRKRDRNRESIEEGKKKVPNKGRKMK